MLKVSTLWEMIYLFLNNISQRQLFRTRSQWIVCLSLGCSKGGSQRNYFGYRHTGAHRYTGWRNLTIILCFCFVYVRLELILNSRWECCSCFSVQRYNVWPFSDPLPMKFCTGSLWSTDQIQPAVLSFAVWQRRMIITARRRKLRMNGRLINNKCHPACPMPHIPVAFTATSDSMLEWNDSLPKDYRQLRNKEE